MSASSPSDINPAIAGEVELFENLDVFQEVLLGEFEETEFTTDHVITAPESLIADGAGYYLRFNSRFAIGELEGYRPFPGIGAVRARFRPTDAKAMTDVASKVEPKLGYIVLRLFHTPGVRYKFGELTVDTSQASGVISYRPDAGDYSYQLYGDDPIDLTILNILEAGELEIWHRLGIPPLPLFQKLREGATTEERTHVLPRSELLENIAYSLSHLPRSGFARMMILRLKLGELLCLLGEGAYSLSGGLAGNVPVSEVRRLAHARSILSEHFASPPSIVELSRMVGLNRKKLTEGFKRMFGDTVGGYSLELRMRHGYDLLKLREHSVTEVALACGYEHASNFTLAFRRRFGVSPTQFRAQHDFV